MGENTLKGKCDVITLCQVHAQDIVSDKECVPLRHGCVTLTLALMFMSMFAFVCDHHHNVH